MFLLRTAFWLSVVILLIPAAPSGDGTGPRTAGTGEALAAAQAAMRDAAGFCGRNPEACEAGSAALAAFGQKAQTGARWLYEFIGAQLASYDKRERPDAVSQHTLKPQDLEPRWRGPEPKRPAA
jgi:hypothetical protein